MHQGGRGRGVGRERGRGKQGRLGRSAPDETTARARAPRSCASAQSAATPAACRSAASHCAAARGAREWAGAASGAAPPAEPKSTSGLGGGSGESMSRLRCFNTQRPRASSLLLPLSAHRSPSGARGALRRRRSLRGALGGRADDARDRVPHVLPLVGRQGGPVIHLRQMTSGGAGDAAGSAVPRPGCVGESRVEGVETAGAPCGSRLRRTR